MNKIKIDKNNLVNKLIVTVCVGVIGFVGANYLKPIFSQEESRMSNPNEVMYPLNPVIGKESKIVFSSRVNIRLDTSDLDVEVNGIFFKGVAEYYRSSFPPLWSISLDQRKDIQSVLELGENQFVFIMKDQTMKTNVFLIDENTGISVANNISPEITEPVSFENFDTIRDYFHREFGTRALEINGIYSQSMVVFKVVMQGYLLDGSNPFFASMLSEILGERVDYRIKEIYEFRIEFEENTVTGVDLKAGIASGVYTIPDGKVLSFPDELNTKVKDIEQRTKKDLFDILKVRN